MNINEILVLLSIYKELKIPDIAGSDEVVTSLLNKGYISGYVVGMSRISRSGYEITSQGSDAIFRLVIS